MALSVAVYELFSVKACDLAPFKFAYSASGCFADALPLEPAPGPLSPRPPTAGDATERKAYSCTPVSVLISS